MMMLDDHKCCEKKNKVDQYERIRVCGVVAC